MIGCATKKMLGVRLAPRPSTQICINFSKKKIPNYGSDGITEAVPCVAKLHARNPISPMATPAIAILPTRSWPGVLCS